MFEIFHMFLLPVIIGIILFSYLEGKLHLSLPRLIGLGRTIGFAVFKPLVGALRQLLGLAASRIVIKKGAGDFQTREQHAPRW